MARLALPLPRTTPLVTSQPFRAQAVSRSQAATAATIAALFLLASAALSLYLAQMSSVSTAGYQLEQLRAERQEWIARNGQLDLEIAKRRSLVWSESQATGRMGMVPADKPVFLNVDTAPPVECGVTSDSCVNTSAQTPASAALAAKPARPTSGNPLIGFEALRVWLVSVLRAEG